MLWRSHQHLNSNNADHALTSLTEGGACDTSERPRSWRNSIIPCNTFQHQPQPPLGRRSLDPIRQGQVGTGSLLTRIYLLSQKQTCQSSKQRTGKGKAMYFFFVFRRCHIQYGDFGASSKFATQRHPVGCFGQSSSHGSICWVPSPQCEPSW